MRAFLYLLVLSIGIAFCRFLALIAYGVNECDLSRFIKYIEVSV